MDPWEAVEPDREALAHYLGTLESADWSAPSWCDEWNVKAVAAHLLVPATKSKGEVFLSFVKSGFYLHKMSQRYVDAICAAMSTDEIVATTGATAGVRTAPPGLAPIGVLSDLVVHSVDIARAIGKPLTLPTEHYLMALDHMKTVQPVLGCKKRIAGLELRTTDAAWSTGEGPLVQGPADLVLAAMTGRRAALSGLTGPGVEVLASR
ncbi:MAG: maleylpyruvate isomerase family mycothiol-dependent enzyme [Nocardioides sp.]